MKIAAIGRTKMLYDSVLHMQMCGHKVVLIITSTPAPEYSIQPKDFSTLAEKIGAQYILTTNLNHPDILTALRELQPDIGISVNWVTLIEEPFLNRFRFGILNAHAGDLPRFRGNAAPNWAIICEEERVGLCIHQMTPELDAGPIYLKRYMAITKDMYIQDVYNFLEKNIPEMFAVAINNIEHGILPQPQPHMTPLRGYPRLPRDGEIDWAEDGWYILAQIRATSHPLPGAYTWLDGKRLTIWKAALHMNTQAYLSEPGQVAKVDRDAGNVWVTIGNGQYYLILKRVQVEGQTEQPASEVITSTRIRLGMDVTGEIQRIKKELTELKEKRN